MLKKNSRDSSPEGRGGLHRAGECDLGPQVGSEKQRKTAEDAAVVLRETTEAAGGRLCIADQGFNSSHDPGLMWKLNPWEPSEGLSN